MKPDFNRLHLFYQVFRHCSIAGAAKELFVTQSAVSQNLQKLEQELNFPLFHRLHKKLVPTPAAEQLYQSIMPFFSNLDANIQAIHITETDPQGLLRIGAPPVFGAEFLPSIFAEFRCLYPSVKFHCTLGSQSEIAQAFRNSELDIALVDIFGNREEESWNFYQEPLIDEPLVLIGSSKYISHHLKNGPTFESLVKCQYIAYKPHAPELTDWFYHHFGSQIKYIDIVLTVENVSAVINAARTSIGLGIVPLYLIQSPILKKELELIKVGNDEVRSRISLLRLAGRKENITERLFIELLKSKISSH